MLTELTQTLDPELTSDPMLTLTFDSELTHVDPNLWPKPLAQNSQQTQFLEILSTNWFNHMNQ